MRTKYKTKSDSRTKRRKILSLWTWGMKHTKGGFKRGSRYPY